ncbi:MAG: GNAT family N-acetyltransferase [Clostridiales bacterium]|nr:GNAT family N-acetyltransferase [Clostridiales bacterium]
MTDYRYATYADLDFLVEERLRFIKVGPTHPNYADIRDNCRAFFENGLKEMTCDAVIAEDNGRCVGTAIAFYYLSVPSSRNHTGRNAYITSVFVEPDYRRQGIASEMLRRIVSRAQAYGCVNIMLTATEMGKPLYEKLGFIQTPGAMLYAPETNA